VTVPTTPGIGLLRRRLRGLPHSSLFRTLQELLDQFPVSALAADNTGRYVAANTLASIFTGFSREELLKMSVKDLVPAMRHDTGDRWNRFIQCGSHAADYVLMRKDGTPLEVHYSAYASVAPGVHVSLLTPVELPSSI
jgi:PAS domain S-box-containing protein